MHYKRKELNIITSLHLNNYLQSSLHNISNSMKLRESNLITRISFILKSEYECVKSSYYIERMRMYRNVYEYVDMVCEDWYLKKARFREFQYVCINREKNNNYERKSNYGGNNYGGDNFEQKNDYEKSNYEKSNNFAENIEQTNNFEKNNNFESHYEPQYENNYENNNYESNYENNNYENNYTLPYKDYTPHLPTNHPQYDYTYDPQEYTSYYDTENTTYFPFYENTYRDKIKSRVRKNTQKANVCAHCNTQHTSLWRRLVGQTVCNACGLYYKIHGVCRPGSLRGNKVVRRKRRSKEKFKEM